MEQLLCHGHPCDEDRGELHSQLRSQWVCPSWSSHHFITAFDFLQWRSQPQSHCARDPGKNNVSEKGTEISGQVTVLTWAQGHHLSPAIATANVSAELHSFWQVPGFLMRAAGDIPGLCHPDTFIFDYLALSHCHTTYQVYLCISVASLGVSRAFCKGLAYGADHRLFSYFLLRTKTNSVGAIFSLLYSVRLYIVSGSCGLLSYFLCFPCVYIAVKMLELICPFASNRLFKRCVHRQQIIICHKGQLNYVGLRTSTPSKRKTSS